MRNERSKLKETFDKLMKIYPKISSLVCYTEAVFITNPTIQQIKGGFYKWVDKKDYEGLKANEIIKNTFTDMLDEAQTGPNERLEIEDLEEGVGSPKWPFLELKMAA